jgi:hypothetical protein
MEAIRAGPRLGLALLGRMVNLRMRGERHLLAGWAHNVSRVDVALELVHGIVWLGLDGRVAW